MTSALMWQVWFRDWSRKALQELTRDQTEWMAVLPFLRSAHSGQIPPPIETGWRNWLLMGGRGAGKTRAGAEFIRFGMGLGLFGRVALVGPTLGDVREVMIEGVSGLRSITDCYAFYPTYSPSRRRLEYPNGAVATVYSAEDPDSLRGPQFDAAWCDEIAAWPNGEAVWDTLQMGVRLGKSPVCVATTTPRPVPLVQRLVAGEAIVTRMRTEDNAEHLAAGFLEQMRRVYGGSALARQELDGELIEDPEGALWTRSMIEAAQTREHPERFDDLIIAVDPPATSGPASDACGIVAVGRADALGFGTRAFVLRDASVHGFRPLDWGARVAALAREVGASRIVAEANQGGEMVRAVLTSAGANVPVELCHARLGKRARAAPVAALYAKGQVAHVGVFRALEDEMCRFGADGFTGSPDRVDALVWAVTTLLVDRPGAPRLRQI